MEGRAARHDPRCWRTTPFSQRLKGDSSRAFSAFGVCEGEEAGTSGLAADYFRA